jgi:hypothetical protein
VTGQQGQGGGAQHQPQQDQHTKDELSKLTQEQRKQFDEHKRNNPGMSDQEILQQVRSGGGQQQR